MTDRPETGTRERKKREVRDRLYDAALGLFRGKGYDAVTVTDITRAAGVAKGTFFNYFQSKADVLAAWYQSMMTLPSLPAGVNTEQALKVIVIDHLRLIEAEPELIAAKITHEATPLMAETERLYDLEVMQVLSHILEADPAVRICPATISGNELAAAVMTFLTGISREWRARKDEIGLVDLGKIRLAALLVMLRGR